jgi:uncharacterized protein (DUF488 family)
MKALYTIGVYGFDADGFFAALREEEVDLLIDIRRRRGVRGREYVFANATRLQARLASLGIAYLPLRELAPDDETRRRQYSVDASHGVAKRARTELSNEFIEGYRERTLDGFNWSALEEVVGHSQRPVLLCVETLPEACHRGLVAEAYSMRSGVHVVHLTP